jgi:hypothetical protein
MLAALSDDDFARGMEALESDEAIEGLDRLTRRDGEPYEAYIGRVAGNPMARRVKLADVADNRANHQRLEPTAQNRARVERYERAQARLLAS